MAANLGNNLWGTNYVMWQPYGPDSASMRFRFVIQVHTGVGSQCEAQGYESIGSGPLILWASWMCFQCLEMRMKNGCAIGPHRLLSRLVVVVIFPPWMATKRSNCESLPNAFPSWKCSSDAHRV